MASEIVIVFGPDIALILRHVEHDISLAVLAVDVSDTTLNRLQRLVDPQRILDRVDSVIRLETTVEQLDTRVDELEQWRRQEVP